MGTLILKRKEIKMSKNNASIAETKKQMEYYMGDVNL